MSRPKEPDPVKLFLSAIYSDETKFETCLAKITEKFGSTDFSTRELDFTKPHYYQEEMGKPIWRRFFAFKTLVDPGELADIKLFTNSLEDEVMVEKMRKVNLDPGLVSLGTFVLATGKPGGVRPYLGKGIYIDLTLIYESSAFKPMTWTYPDFREPDMLDFLKRIRESYKFELRNLNATKD
jgi:uncharacterized protein DUF4416